MTNLLEKTKSSRQTFTIPQYVVDTLETYATEHEKKKSQIVAIALEEYLKKEDASLKVKKRLNALKGLIGIVPDGSLKDIDLKSIRVDKALKNV